MAAGLGLDVAGGSTTHAAWVGPLVKDLLAHKGAAVVIPGEAQPPVVHALAHAMNGALGAIGRTVRYTAPGRGSARRTSSSPCGARRRHGRPARWICCWSSAATPSTTLRPISTSPRPSTRCACAFISRLDDNETSERCHLARPCGPRARIVERCPGGGRDALGGPAPHRPALRRARRPTRCSRPSRRVPTTRPTTRSGTTGRSLLPAATFEAAWQKALHDGLLAGSAFPEKPVTPRLGDWARKTRAPGAGRDGARSAPRPDGAGRTLREQRMAPGTAQAAEQAHLGERRPGRARPPPNGWDSRPRPRPVATSPTCSSSKLAGRTLKAPAWVVPGVPDGTVTLHLGYGRRRAGRVGKGLGVDANTFRTTAAPWSAPGLEVAQDGRAGPRLVHPGPLDHRRSRACRRRAAPDGARHHSRRARRQS